MVISATAGSLFHLTARASSNTVFISNSCVLSQHSVGCAGLRVSSVAGTAHCDIAHCQKVKNPICEDFHWACVGMFIYTDEKLISGRVVQKRFLVSDLLFLYMCRASTQSSGGKNLST